MRAKTESVHVARVAVLFAVLMLLVSAGLATGRAGAAIPPTGAGTVIEFPLPEGGSGANLTVGLDGNLWFDLRRFGKSDEIGRMTPSGKLTTFAILSTTLPGQVKATVEGMATDAYGNVWFTVVGEDGARIGSISTGGEVAFVPLPRPAGFLGAIVAGAGGNLWFARPARRYNSAIGELEADGEVREFPLRNQFTEGIAPGPEGDLWFVGIQPRKHQPVKGVLGRITRAGKVTRLPIPRAERGEVITASGGRLWFGAEAHILLSSSRAWMVGVGSESFPYPHPVSLARSRRLRRTVAAACGSAAKARRFSDGPVPTEKSGGPCAALEPPSTSGPPGSLAGACGPRAVTGSSCGSSRGYRVRAYAGSSRSDRTARCGSR